MMKKTTKAEETKKTIKLNKSKLARKYNCKLETIDKHIKSLGIDFKNVTEYEQKRLREDLKQYQSNKDKVEEVKEEFKRRYKVNKDSETPKKDIYFNYFAMYREYKREGKDPRQTNYLLRKRNQAKVEMDKELNEINNKRLEEYHKKKAQEQAEKEKEYLKDKVEEVKEEVKEVEEVKKRHKMRISY